MKPSISENFRWRKRISLLFGVYSTGITLLYILFILDNRNYLFEAGPFLEPVFVVLTFTFLGVLLTYRRPTHRIGWLFLVIALMRQIAFTDDISSVLLARGAEPTYWLMFGFSLSSWVSGLTFTLLAFIIVIFPTGHLPSRRWLLAVVLLGLQAILVIGTVLYLSLDLYQFLTTRGSSNIEIVLVNAVPGGVGALIRHVREVPELLPVLLGMGWTFVALGVMALWSQIAQYRHGSSIIRQQIKWVILAMGGWILVFLLVLIGLPLMDPILARYLPILFFVVLLVPIAITVAILRYRLWDIDIIIRRTLIYGTLTGLLVLIYFGIVTLLQSLVTTLSGQESPAVIVLSTLVIAALFSPLRNRIQTIIDRRFYRRKYDAEQILAEFALSARDKVNQDELAEHLLGVVEGTLQPASASLWLKGM